MENRMKVRLLPHTPFVKMNGTFDKEKAIHYSAQIAGECYEPLGWDKLAIEPSEDTNKRMNNTLKKEHQSPYEHVNIGMELINIPKILAMILNNERQCSTSEKSSRYTEIIASEDPAITYVEEQLYNKWLAIFKDKIRIQYGHQFKEGKIKTLAQENSRYFVTVFASTKMIHTVPLAQLNRIASYMNDLIGKEKKTAFETKLTPYLEQFLNCLEDINVLDERLQSNRKERSLSIFAPRIVEKHFGDSYSVNYKGSFAQYAQVHRTRLHQHSFMFLDDFQFFIPPIIENDLAYIEMLTEDMHLVKDFYPQGQLISINECGTFESFLLKCKERLCTNAQLETMLQTKEILHQYQQALITSNHPLQYEIARYMNGARCTFEDYTCIENCNFCEGKMLTRKI